MAITDDSYLIRLGRAQAVPTLANVLALDTVVPAAGSVVTVGAGGVATSTTQAAVVPGLTGSATVDVASISAGATAEVTITVTGAVAGSAVFLGLPAAFPAGLTATGYVSATDTVKVRLHNTTAAPIDPGSLVYKARCFAS